MKYKQKENVVDAIQFKYTSDGIEDIQNFAIGCKCITSKARCPDAKAKLELQYTDDKIIVRCIVIEGEWLIKTEDNTFKTCSEYMFGVLYERN